MAMAPKLRFRFKPPRSSPNGDATSFSMYSQPRNVISAPAEPSNRSRVKRKKDEERSVLFVRVLEDVFEVPQKFFLQTPLGSSKTDAGRGLTPEDPIFLKGHDALHFRRVLDAFNSYPSLDLYSMTLDHVLTIGELSIRYRLNDLVQWFLRVFQDLVTSPTTPLRRSSNLIYIRMMKLAMLYKRKDLLASIKSKWISRMHWGELDPLSALLFADVYGLQDLLGHACYVYLMSAEKRIRASEPVDPKGLLNPRQITHIMAGYHSLKTYQKTLWRTPPNLAAAPQCKDHSKCVAVWNFRWSAAMGRPCSLPEVDVLGRLVFIEQCLRADSLVNVCLTPACKAAALKAVSEKRDVISRQLHHHFDL